MSVHESLLGKESQVSVPEAILAKYADRIALVVQNIRVSVADRLSCTTTPAGVGMHICGWRLSPEEKPIVRTAIIERLAEHDIAVRHPVNKRRGKEELYQCEPLPDPAQEQSPEWAFFPAGQIPDRYIPPHALLEKAAEILQKALPSVCHGASLTEGEVPNSVSLNAMSSRIGVEISEGLDRMSLEQIERKSFHRILVNAGIELCIRWAESLGMFVLNEKKSKLRLNTDSGLTTLQQLENIGFRIPDIPADLSFGSSLQHGAAA